MEWIIPALSSVVSWLLNCCLFSCRVGSSIPVFFSVGPRTLRLMCRSSFHSWLVASHVSRRCQHEAALSISQSVLAAVQHESLAFSLSARLQVFLPPAAQFVTITASTSIFFFQSVYSFAFKWKKQKTNQAAEIIFLQCFFFCPASAGVVDNVQSDKFEFSSGGSYWARGRVYITSCKLFRSSPKTWFMVVHIIIESYHCLLFNSVLIFLRERRPRLQNRLFSLL